MSIYCGNNKNHSSLKNGSKIGKRYTCLKKGIGVGLNLAYDPEHKKEFIPIDSRKIYCGKASKLPKGYDIMGNNLMCFQKGVGVGKTIKAKKGKK